MASAGTSLGQRSPRIIVGVVRDAALDGGFATVKGVDVSCDVEDFLELVKAQLGDDLASVARRRMALYGPWPEPPKTEVWAAELKNTDNLRAPNVKLSSLLLADGQDCFFIVRVPAVTAPLPSPGAGASLYHIVCARR